MSMTLAPVQEVSLGYLPSTFVYLLVTCLSLWLAYFRMSRKRLYQLAETIPGPKGYPLIGHAHLMVGKSNDIFQKLYSLSFAFKEGSPVKAWLGPRLLVFLMDPRDIELILGSHIHIDKAPEYRLFEPWLGDGLLISTGEKWRTHRKIIAPTFHLNVLKSFIGLFNVNSRYTVEKMRREGMKKEFDVHHYMSACTVEILLETAMGVDKTTQKASGFDYAVAVMKMCEILHLRHTKLWLRPDSLFGLTHYAKEQIQHLDFIHSLTTNVIKEKKELYQKKKEVNGEVKPKAIEVETEKKTEKSVLEVVKGSSFGQSAGLKDDLDVDDDVGEKKRQAFLDLMLECAENEQLLTDKELREQVDTIMFEGHDTTAAASSFFLCVMGARPDIQEKVVAELESIFGDSDRPVTFEDTLEMKYMERCIMETLRLYPPVPIIARELQQEVKTSENMTLPAKCTVIVATLKLHRLPSIYPDPETFNPDNFLPEVTSKRHYYAFVPFSAGPSQLCWPKIRHVEAENHLGNSFKELQNKQRYKREGLILQADIILKRPEGFNISLEPRVMRPKKS